MPCYGRMAEGAVAGGMAQSLQDAWHAHLVGQFQDLGDVVAGCATVSLDESVGEGLGDLAQPQELLLEHVAARAVPAELSLVLG